MDGIGILFTVVFVIIIIANVIRKVKAADPDFQEKLNRGLAAILKSQTGTDEYYDNDEIKIYDENGNIISLNAEPETADTVIYDESGEIMSMPTPPPLKKSEETTPAVKVEKVPEENEPETDADMYRDFISDNGGSAIVVQEILAKPLALR